MKRWIIALALLLSPSLALKAQWKTLDVNGDGSPEHVAVTNLMDLALNEQGEIVGWYVKPVKGRVIKDYNRALNLIRKELPQPGLVGVGLEQARFTTEDGYLIARFSGPEARLVYRISPHHYTIHIDYDLPQGGRYRLNGIGGSDRPVTKILLQGQQQPQPQGEGPTVYAAIQSQPTRGYALVFWPKAPMPARLKPEGPGALIEVELPPGEGTFRVYGGQNELVRFHVEGLLELPGLFSPNVWGRLSLLIIGLLEFFHDLTGNWGLAILLLTLVVRLLIWPLMHQQFKSMTAMQRLKPLVDEINKKYKDDPEKKNKALMELYAEHKVNPAAGCLPMLIQLPILFILWRVIANYEFGEGFLWIPDLSLPDPYYILPVLYVVVMIAQTLMMSQGNKDQLRQALFMNLIFVYLILQFPAGVTLYWVFSTLIGLFQQWLINKQLKAQPAKG